jgi:FkbM family methyltransferase
VWYTSLLARRIASSEVRLRRDGPKIFDLVPAFELSSSQQLHLLFPSSLACLSSVAPFSLASPSLADEGPAQRAAVATAAVRRRHLHRLTRSDQQTRARNTEPDSTIWETTTDSLCSKSLCCSVLNVFLLGFILSHISQSHPVVRVEMGGNTLAATPQQHQLATVEFTEVVRPVAVRSAPFQRVSDAVATPAAAASGQFPSWAQSWASSVPALPRDPADTLPPLSDTVERQLHKTGGFGGYEGIAKLPEHKDVMTGIEKIQQRIPSGPIYVLDVGLNLGAVSMGILEVCSRCIVWGFEPIPNYFSFARKILTEHYPDRVHLFNYAVCDGPGPRTIHMDTGASANVGWNTLISSKKTDGQVDLGITCVTLDAIFAQILAPAGVPHVDFMKIDVEGAERLVWLGGHQFLSSHPSPKPLIHVEIGWGGARDDWQMEVAEFEWLFAHGYKRFDHTTIHGTQNIFIEPQM